MASVANAAESVWKALRAPGSVIVLRHSYEPGGVDPPGARLEDCSTQRNFDENGRAQAKRIGEAFKQNGIAVGTVWSSPRCRCLDTARLAFGQAQVLDALQGALNDEERRRRQLAEIKKVIASHESPVEALDLDQPLAIDLVESQARHGLDVIEDAESQ